MKSECCSNRTRDDQDAFLKKYDAAANFLVSGRKVPRDGGIVLAVGDGEQIEVIAREDPFCARGLADVRVIEFRASQRSSVRTLFRRWRMEDSLSCLLLAKYRSGDRQQA